MHSNTRQKKLLEILDEEKALGINALKKKTGIAHATIYRDLRVLEDEGKIRKNHGEIELLAGTSAVRDYDKRIKLNADLKIKIAQKALSYIKPGDHVFLDASSTCYFLGMAILRHDIERVTIATNSIHLQSEYRMHDTQVKLVSTGGSIDRELNALLGELTVDFIRRVRFAKIFISAAGCSVPEGIGTTSDFILSVLKAAFASARERYCLIDSAKFGRECLFRIAPLSAFDAIITDDGIGREVIRKIKKAGGKLVISGNHSRKKS